MERTLLLVKPDGVLRGLLGKIITPIEDTGLKVVAMKLVWPDKKFAGEHYIYDEKWLKSVGAKTRTSYEEKGIKFNKTDLQQGELVRQYLIDYISSGPVAAFLIEGNEAISIVRKLMGVTSPIKADPSSIRGKYSSDSYPLADGKQRAVHNLVHASEDKATAEREIKLWFKKGEIVEYKRVDENIMY